MRVSTADELTCVWRAAGVDPDDVTEVKALPCRGGSGAASAEVHLITAELRGGESLRVVSKRVRPLRSGRHAEGARAPDHWAHWSRELTAYRSGVLPTGPGLRAPRLLTVVGDTLYIEDGGELRPEPAEAAVALGRWHHADRTPARPWFARDQLAQRLAVSQLDWSAVDVDPRLRTIWDSRHEYLARLATLPRGTTHGDFTTPNLRVRGEDVIALDWATLGTSPVGLDLAHLALATLDEHLLPSYLEGLQGRFDADSVRLGERAAVSLVGASRGHWMASRSIPLPAGYVDFVDAHRL